MVIVWSPEVQSIESGSGEAPDEYNSMQTELYGQGPGLLSPDVMKRFRGITRSAQRGKVRLPGIEYIQPGMRSALPGRHRLSYEDQQAIEYIRPCVRSIICPDPHILKYEDQQGIEYIRRPERSMCYDRQVLDYVIQKKTRAHT